MAGQAQSREKLRAVEAGLRRMGLSTAAVLNGTAQVANGEDDCPGDSTSGTENTRGRGRARFSRDFREQTLEIAEDCARMLRGAPDRDTAQVYRSMIDILQRIEEQDPKDPTPRPEDVRKGVVDMLTILPDLCANDTELRALAVEALAAVVAQGEAAE